MYLGFVRSVEKNGNDSNVSYISGDARVIRKYLDVWKSMILHRRTGTIMIAVLL